MNLLQFFDVFLVLGIKTGHRSSMWSNKCWKMRCNPSLDLLAVSLLTHPRRLLVILAAKAHGWPMFSYPLGPQSFCRTAAPQLVPPQPGLLQGCFLPRDSTLCLSLLYVIRFLLACSCSISRLPWMAAWSSRVPICSLNLVSSANLIRVNSIPSSRSLTKTWNRMGARRDSSGTHSR